MINKFLDELYKTKYDDNRDYIINDIVGTLREIKKNANNDDDDTNNVIDKLIKKK